MPLEHAQARAASLAPEHCADLLRLGGAPFPLLAAVVPHVADLSDLVVLVPDPLPRVALTPAGWAVLAQILASVLI